MSRVPRSNPKRLNNTFNGKDSGVGANVTPFWGRGECDPWGRGECDPRPIRANPSSWKSAKTAADSNIRSRIVWLVWFLSCSQHLIMVIFQTFHQSHPKSLAHPGSKRQERGPTGVRLDSPKVIVGWFAKRDQLCGLVSQFWICSQVSSFVMTGTRWAWLETSIHNPCLSIAYSAWGSMITSSPSEGFLKWGIPKSMSNDLDDLGVPPV